ncbi:MAG: sigma-54 dependent transcriptional regulator [Carboxylicivirga sp.]|nr:sigma-54 dependent transcriptional regulator [Carboxylicivirga sp.]
MILIVDDDIAVQASLQLLMRDAGFETAVAGRQGEALKVLNTQSVSLVLLDMNFSVDTSGKDGLELLGDIKDRWPQIPVILITGWGSIELAVEWMRKGAFDFISKPWDNQRLLSTVKNALTLTKGKKSERKSRQKLDDCYAFASIIGQHQSVLNILETIVNVAPTTAPVLISGESGTGKELVARAIHDNSERKDQPFVSVNLGAIPPNLFESEMFGYRKGAFTDARNDKPGKFELANGGTLFLDEIGEMDLNAQVKLLRVLQEQQVDRIGDIKSRPIDVRIVCATNRKLPNMVEQGSFREDLYYRINLINMELPPLRDRKSDIPLLANYFLQQSAGVYNKEIQAFDDQALQYLKRQVFEGNIRELKNCVERAVLYCNQRTIGLEVLKHCLAGNSVQRKQELPDVGSMTLEEMEKQMIINALKKYKNNISQSADALGLSRQMLYRRMEKYGLKTSLDTKENAL